MDSFENKGHGEKYSRLKEQALAALLASPTIKEAAAKSGIGESTLRRWLKRPVFRQEYDGAKRHTHQAATGDLPEAAVEALATLRTVLKPDQYRSDRDRIASAKVISDWHLKQLMLIITQRRVSRSERR